MLGVTRSTGRGEGKSDVHLDCQCGQTVLVRVLSIGRGVVHLGFEASRAVAICRADAKARTQVRAEGTARDA